MGLCAQKAIRVNTPLMYAIPYYQGDIQDMVSYIIYEQQG